MYKLGNVTIYSNFYHISDVKYFINRVNELMVTDIEWTTKEITFDNPHYYNTHFKITALHMGDVVTEHRMIVHRLHRHNKDLLIEYVNEYLKG